MPQPEKWSLLLDAVTRSPSVWLIIGLSVGIIAARVAPIYPTALLIGTGWLLLIVAFVMEWHRAR